MAAIVGAGAAIVALGVGAWLLAVRRGPSAPPAVEVVTVATPAPRPAEVVKFEQGCATAECHAAMRPGKARHPAVASAACGQCHEPDAGGHVYPFRGDGTSACTSCHVSKPHGRFDHGAMTDTGCTGCHSVHKDEARYLLAAGTIGATCATCHPIQRGAHDHVPYATGRCDLCHDPHGSNAPALLSGSGGPDHCRRCHAATVELTHTAPHSHARVAEGCVACHAPHSAPADHLLRAEPRAMCVRCHEEVGREVAGATISHDAVLKGDQCGSCHEPHGSSSPSMLRADQTTVCLKCHAEPVRAADGRIIAAMHSVATTPVVHGPVASGQCSACHTVHGGSHQKLLTGLNPKVPAMGFDLRNFALCFSCHDPALVLDDRAGATLFRDGEENLHRSHMMSTKGGRSCAVCHVFHGGDSPRLMARSVAFEGSAWAMPINFRVTEDGGTCSPGCHEPLGYGRTRAINSQRRKDGVP